MVDPSHTLATHSAQTLHLASAGWLTEVCVCVYLSWNTSAQTISRQPQLCENDIQINIFYSKTVSAINTSKFTLIE